VEWWNCHHHLTVTCYSTNSCDIGSLKGKVIPVRAMKACGG
jgi:hypothetical protein